MALRSLLPRFLTPNWNPEYSANLLINWRVYNSKVPNRVVLGYRCKISAYKLQIINGVIVECLAFSV